MRPARPYIRYRRDLKSRAQSLRHDPTPAERKLWYEFLSTHRAKFTRRKPLGCYIADFYCAQKRLVIELDGDTHFTDKGERHDARGYCAAAGKRRAREAALTLTRIDRATPYVQQKGMPRRSSKDLNQIAASILEAATGRPARLTPKGTKNPAAVALRRLGGLRRGKARVKALSPANKRVRIGKKAASGRGRRKS